jgi:LytR cell envelope-related transcriptional attenuator
MSTPKNGGPDRRMRTAGVALIALAVMAATIGVVLVFAHSRHPTVPSPATPTIAAPPPRPTMIPFPPPLPTSPAAIPSPQPVPAVPGAAAAGEAMPAGGPAGGTAVSRGEIRVYNNSTIRGLAARVARDLTAAGWTVVEVGNYPWGIIPTTTVYYQEDFSKDSDQRAGAEALASEFGMRVEPRSQGITHVGPGLIVIVTNDYRH